MYYIITKIELVEGDVVRTIIGYLDTLENLNTFKGLQGETFDDWVQNNSGNIESGSTSVVSYFSSNTESYVSYIKTDYIPEGLSLITNLSNPES